MKISIEYDKLRCRGNVVELREVGLRTLDGKVVAKDLVRHPGAVVMVPILDDGSIVLIRNHRWGVQEELWELPAGTLNTGEDPLRAAGRELAEETGYSAQSLSPLGSFYSAPGISDERMHAYVARELTAGRQKLESDEAIRVEILAEADARQMILDGTIRDGKTIAALAMYWMLDSGAD